MFIPLFLLAGLGTMSAGEKEAAFMACIYNLIAKRFGGIKVELQPVHPVSNLGLD